jgi:hypothetical protein
VVHVSSGPAKADRLYWVLIVVLCLGLFGYFMYDWQIGYLNRNISEARKEVGQLLNTDPAEVKIPEPERPTRADFDALFADQPGTTRITPEQIRSTFGEPITTSETADGNQVEYYASHYGMATVTYRGGQPIPEWRKWFKSKDQIEAQLYWGLIPLAFGIFAVYKLVRASTLRVVVDDEGLRYRNDLITFDRMSALRDFNPKGWIDLYYQDGKEQKLRLDNQKIAKFDEVVDAICQKTGFPNQVAEYRAKRAAEEAEAEAMPEPTDEAPAEPEAGDANENEKTTT